MSADDDGATRHPMSDDAGSPENDQFRSLCMAVGFVVLNWALIEQQVDNWVRLAFLTCGGKELRKRNDVPRSFNAKADFLRECFRKLPSLKPFAREGLPLIDRIHRVAKRRHELVHGGIVSLEAPEGRYQFRRIEYVRGDQVVSTFRFDPSAFHTLEISLGEALTDQLAFSQRLADAFRE